MSFRIRAATAADLKPLYEMAKLAGSGLTNLPADRAALAAKLAISDRAFSRFGEKSADDVFVMALEDAATGEVRGTAQMFAQVGQTWPFYSYRLTTLTRRSQELHRTVTAEMLTLTTDLEGSSEVGGLFVHPAERASGHGLLLARSRYLFIAMHRPRFGHRIIAELRGIVDEKGGSPFWDAIAGRFFGMTFQEADYFNAIHGSQFIADLMPRHPIYTALLSDAARSVIGLPHPSGRAAMRMLEEEGFAYDGYVDVFDGGPTMIARTDQIATIRAAREAEVGAATCLAGRQVLLAAGRLAAFRCCCGVAKDVPEGIEIDAESAAILDLAPGDRVWLVDR